MAFERESALLAAFFVFHTVTIADLKDFSRVEHKTRRRGYFLYRYLCARPRPFLMNRLWG